MKKIQQVTLERAITLLDACGCTYAIIDSDGVKHGDLALALETKRKEFDFPFGAITAHIKKYLTEMKIGDVVEMPPGEFGAERVRSTAISILCKKDGKGCYTSTITNDMVEIMRIG